MRRFALILLIAAVGAFGGILRIDNGIIEVAMDDSTGRFSMGKNSGEAFIQGFPSSVEGGYIVARIAGLNYSNKPGIGMPLTLFDGGRIPEDNYMTIQWIRDPIRLWQKFYLMPEESLDAFCDIELLAYNDGADSQAVAFKIFIDAKVGENTNPILEFATGVQTFTNRYFGDAIPAYWTLYEHSIRQDSTYTHAQGVPFGTDMLHPDEVAFANVSDLDISDWYSYFPIGGPFTDLAMTFRWDNIDLPAYSWYIVQIYYGGGYPSFGIGERRYDRPNILELGRPYPNPFNARVTVPFEVLARPRLVSWSIYDIGGRAVRHSDPATMESGEYSIVWDGRTDFGGQVGSGIYLFTIWADGVRYTKRLIILE